MVPHNPQGSSRLPKVTNRYPRLPMITRLTKVIQACMQFKELACSSPWACMHFSMSLHAVLYELACSSIWACMQFYTSLHAVLYELAGSYMSLHAVLGMGIGMGIGNGLILIKFNFIMSNCKLSSNWDWDWDFPIWQTLKSWDQCHIILEFCT